MITAQKMKFSIQNFFSKCDQIRIFLRIWSHLLRKSLMENFIFCTFCDHKELMNLQTYSELLFLSAHLCPLYCLQVVLMYLYESSADIQTTSI